MTLKELAEKAVSERDANAAGHLADILRFRFGLNYPQTYEFVNQIVPVTPAAWDALVYEADVFE